MVNEQPGQCIDAYNEASQKIPYCGKTLALKPCDPLWPKPLAVRVPLNTTIFSTSAARSQI